MTNFLLGIDGGGSKTVALLAGPDGHVIGRGTAEAANYQAIGLERACAAIVRAVAAAFVDARIAPGPVGAVCLGLAGAGRPEDQALFQTWAAQQWPGARVMIASDAELVLAAGTPGAWGLALICGTGSIAYARDRAGRAARAGGWGYLLGDEGSGYAIGLAALHAVARAADGRGPPTTLTGAVLAHWSLGAPQDLIRRVYRVSCSNAEVAALAGLVVGAAADGDATARQIIEGACRELALMLSAAAGQLEMRGPLPCALAGGLIVNQPALAWGVRAAAADLGLALDPVARVAEPAVGAIGMAARLL
ncbi:MAG: N-acetylglucosamine kinase [Roseiflexaceae bacterium]